MGCDWNGHHTVGKCDDDDDELIFDCHARHKHDHDHDKHNHDHDKHDNHLDSDAAGNVHAGHCGGERDVAQRISRVWQRDVSAAGLWSDAKMHE